MERYGITVRAGTPREVIDKLKGAIKRVINDTSLNKCLMVIGATPITSTPEDFAAFLDKEIKKNDEAVQWAGVKRN